MVPSPAPLARVALAALLALLLAPRSLADFTARDLPGPFIRRHGLAACPDNLSFRVASTASFSPSELEVNGAPCSAGALSFVESPRDPAFGGLLAVYLSAERGAGTVLAGAVSERLQCDAHSFSAYKTFFTFVKPNANVSVELARAFQRNGTALQRAVGARFVFEKDVPYVVVGSLCLYTPFSDAEFDAQLGEACFPGDALVAVAPRPAAAAAPPPLARCNASVAGDIRCDNGDDVDCKGEAPTMALRRMADLSVGDAVWSRGSDGNAPSLTHVIGWTHRSAQARAPFVELRLSDGRTLTLSGNHLLPLDGALRAARRARVGMRAQTWVAARRKAECVDRNNNYIRDGDGGSEDAAAAVGMTTTARVVGTRWVWRTGVFNAQTESGWLVVDGVVCSAYTSAVGAQAGHALLGPVRAAARIGGWDVLRWSGAFADESALWALLRRGRALRSRAR